MGVVVVDSSWLSNCAMASCGAAAAAPAAASKEVVGTGGDVKASKDAYVTAALAAAAAVVQPHISYAEEDQA
jgi:hypothetical protein